jgi:hypothetical protein
LHRKLPLTALVLAFLCFLVIVLCSIAVPVYGQAETISLDTSSGPVGTEVTITGTGWDAFKPGPLSGSYYLTLIWCDHQPELNTGIQNWRSQPGLYGITDFQVNDNGGFVLTATIQSSWNGTGYFGIANENPSSGYLRGIFADAAFTVTSSSSGSSGSLTSDNLNAGIATTTGVAATGAAVALVVGQRIPLTRKRDFGNQQVEREVDQSTGISFQKPPESYVKQFNPPVGNPEKATRGDVLRDWTLTPEYVKQAWRNYDVCQQNAALCQSQIDALQKTRSQVGQIHRSNLAKATLKLGLKTTEIIANGVQMGYLDKLTRLHELAMAKNSFTQARLLGESISALENATKSVSNAQLAYEATIQSAGKLKGLLAEWNQRMSSDYVRPDNLRDAVTGKPLGWIGRAADAREFDKARIMTLDEGTKRFVQPALNRFNQLIAGEYTGRSYDEAVKDVLQQGVKDALAEMGRQESALENANQTFQTALESANSIMAGSKNLALAGEAVDLGTRAVHDGELSSSEGGLDPDDPAKLADGQGELERLQNQINWLKKHYQMAIDCMNQNMETINGYNETKSNEGE